MAAATAKPAATDETSGEATPVPVVKIDMSNTSMVYAQTLEQIKEQGIVAELDMGNGIVWSIDGSTISDEGLQDINLEVTVGSQNIPQELVGSIAQDAEYVEISLTHDGAFGFDATLSIDLDNGTPGQYGNLFYYNEATKSMEFLCASVVDENNKVSFVFKHASEYVIVISNEAMQEAAKSESDTEVTAETQNAATEKTVLAQSKESPLVVIQVIVVIVVASIVIGTGILLLIKKRSSDIFDQEEAEEEYDGDDDDDEYDGWS